MITGKLTPEELTEIVFSRLPEHQEMLTCGPGNGLDCAALRIPEGSRQIIMSSDPITGAGKDIGRLAVHVSCNDLAAFGVRPSALMLVLIAPPSATKQDLITIMDQVGETAKLLDIIIAGGHTEISDAVNRFVLTTTAIGYQSSALIQSGGARAGDSLIMTKQAAIEGTAILAVDFKEQLKEYLTEAELLEGASMIEKISVVTEGICSAKSGAHAMHDVTEGGILGAAWEMAEAAGLGLNLEQDRIPVGAVTTKICRFFQINPYRLIGSGSMLIASDNPELIVSELAGLGINASVIGTFSDQKIRTINRNGSIDPLDRPGRDELYRCFDSFTNNLNNVE